jgi:hypothetical protein
MQTEVGPLESGAPEPTATVANPEDPSGIARLGGAKLPAGGEVGPVGPLQKDPFVNK